MCSPAWSGNITRSPSPLSIPASLSTAPRASLLSWVETTVYRGGLDLRGVEIDHVWLAATHPDPCAPDPQLRTPFVVDVAFPLFVDHFVEVLRRFVAGDATAAELDRAAAGAGVRQRVVGLFPAPVRYLGVPVWSARD
jgi:hypothetical protein